MRYLMTFAYDGSKYKGYQKQIKERTIQGEIEKALKTINGRKAVSIHASGRTDAGVHAYNQKAKPRKRQTSRRIAHILKS